MSWQAIAWVLERSESRLSAQLGMIWIANYAKPDGSGAYPSITTLARKAKLSDRTAQVAIKELQQLGEVHVELNAGPHGANLYSLPLMRGKKISPLGVRTIYPPGEKSDIGVVNSSAPADERFSPEPSREPLKEPSVNRGVQLSVDPTEHKYADAPSAPANKNPWALILEELKSKVNPQSYETWFRPTRFGGVSGSSMVVFVPSVEWSYMTDTFRPQLRQAMDRLKLPYTRIEFEASDGRNVYGLRRTVG